MWGVLFYANNESKSALARELGDCSDNKWKLAKLVFACLEIKRHCVSEMYTRAKMIH